VQALGRWQQVRQDGARLDVRRARRRGLAAQRAVYHVVDDGKRDVVQHDRRDDFRCPAGGLEPARDTRPDRPGERAGQQGQRQVDDHGQALDHEAGHRGDQRAHVELPLRADVEQPGGEAERDA